MSRLAKFIPFIKIDAAKREVYGIVTAEVPDKDGEVCDYEGSKPYYQEWSDEFVKATNGASLGNLREMHSLQAAGKGVALEFRDDAKEIFMGFKVVDDDAWKKVEEGVYTGFSQGGSIIGDMKPDPVYKECKRYVAKPSEVSLVDNPCLGVAHFAYVKADGNVEMRKLRTAKAEGKATDPAIELESFNKALDRITALESALAKPGQSAAPKTKADVSALITRIANELQLEKSHRLMKGLYQIGQLASVLETLKWIEDCAAWEAESEGDDRDEEIASELHDALAHLVEILKLIVEDETSELLTAAKAESNQGVSKMDIGDLLKAAKSSLAAHFKKAAAHHEKMAGHHEAMASTHTEKAEFHAKCMGKAAEGDGLHEIHKASHSHHKAMAAHHEKCAKAHGAHAEHLHKMAEAHTEAPAEKVAKAANAEAPLIPVPATPAATESITKADLAAALGDLIKGDAFKDVIKAAVKEEAGDKPEPVVAKGVIVPRPGETLAGNTTDLSETGF